MNNCGGPKAATKVVWSGEQDEMWKHVTLLAGPDSC